MVIVLQNKLFFKKKNDQWSFFPVSSLLSTNVDFFFFLHMCIVFGCICDGGELCH